MEESNSPSKVTPYELATLASRIYPERCASDPKEAIAAAQRLLEQAKISFKRAEEEKRRDEEEWEALLESRADWVHGVKYITGERRRDRATRWFAEFMQHEAPGNDLSHYKRDGFTLDESESLREKFTKWKKQPKRQKGKQGRRISERDGRLRTDLVGLIPRKPRNRGEKFSLRQTCKKCLLIAKIPLSRYQGPKTQ